ncbi:hypothetical protein CROQUDRAFT_99781 [Cronartium quercuum f. sp. fusiforme G11]|uniref:Uncharacterized protein n=1 Tax=Cronartium quercuum f. sp. fusiforme G11 TaxID=708437 RepID=A0A9P6T662_9BASI|nr:hypothetical protein CROQUDRAFT_99781 [Cronartium quercuum f. sp. fusiforme G11]
MSLLAPTPSSPRLQPPSKRPASPISSDVGYFINCVPGLRHSADEKQFAFVLPISQFRLLMMVVGKLRMKNDRESSDLLTERGKSKRRCRQPTRSPSVDPPPATYGYMADESIDVFPSGSSSTSRAYHNSKGKQRATEPGIGDELVINWTTTSAQVANRLLSMPAQNDREFKLKLQDALRAEDDVRFESLIEEDPYLPRRWQSSNSHRHTQTDMDGHLLGRMEAEEYDEYIRKRMWSRTNRTDYLNTKDREEKDREGRERVAQARAQQKLDRQKKEKLRAEKESRRKDKDLKRCRASYEQRWEIINFLQFGTQTGATKTSSTFLNDTRQILRPDEIPWPFYPPELVNDCFPFPTPPADQITHHSVKQFLIGHIPASDSTAKRKVIRAALLVYHPDRFNRLIHRIKDIDGAQSKVRELGLRVSQILNELNHDL